MGTIEAENEALARELTAELNAGNLDALEEYLEDGYGEADPRPTVSEIRREEEARREAFPDYHEDITTLTTNGEDVVVIYNVSGTHEGAASPDGLYRNRSIVFTVPPTGNEVFFSLIRRFKNTDGQVTLYESMLTPLTLLRQLGLDWEQFTTDLPEYVSDA